MPALTSLTDGLVTIRPPGAGDVETLLAGRDAEFDRWLGPGFLSPAPTACISVAGEIVGWVDYDVERDWLGSDEVNVGYSLSADHRGKGYATRAVKLLLRYLEDDTSFQTATVLIDPDNGRSLSVAERVGFEPAGEVDGQRYLKRRVGSARTA